MKRTEKKQDLHSQVKQKINSGVKEKKEYDGDFGTIISTGSTLLDLAISGSRVRGGGLPGGILVEIFGPSGSGKTVFLSEIGGRIQKQGGDIMFHDPEARLNKQFANMFDLTVSDENYKQSNTVTEVFKDIRAWEPAKTKKKVIHGILADSLAALSTDTEMEKEEGDKMGMRRAKEFSEELRKTCRLITQNNYLMVCSNQVRVNTDAGPYGQKYTTPGGEAVGFYASVRLRTLKPEKLKKKVSIKGKEVTKVTGIQVQIEVFKNSVAKPYGIAPITILFDYGIDDIRENLQYIKDFKKTAVYCVGDLTLDKSIEESIKMVERDPKLIDDLREEVIDLWEEIETKFESNRKKLRP